MPNIPLNNKKANNAIQKYKKKSTNYNQYFINFITIICIVFHSFL